MATTEAAASGTMPRDCKNAREYVRDRLAESDEPLSPVELAEEYGCSKGYARTVLSELHGSGMLDRPADGQYALAGDGDPATGSDSSDLLGFGDEIMGSPDDTTDSGTSDMAPTQTEYEAQHAESSAGAPGDEEHADHGESDQNPSPGAGSGDPDGGGSDAVAPTAPLPMEPYKLGLVLGIGLALFLLYRGVGGSDGDTGTDTSELEDGTDDQEGGGDDLAGGLVG